jgi:hypothetical protein
MMLFSYPSLTPARASGLRVTVRTVLTPFCCGCLSRGVGGKANGTPVWPRKSSTCCHRSVTFTIQCSGQQAIRAGLNEPLAALFVRPPPPARRGLFALSKRSVGLVLLRTKHHCRDQRPVQKPHKQTCRWGVARPGLNPCTSYPRSPAYVVARGCPKLAPFLLREYLSRGRYVAPKEQ